MKQCWRQYIEKIQKIPFVNKHYSIDSMAYQCDISVCTRISVVKDVRTDQDLYTACTLGAGVNNHSLKNGIGLGTPFRPITWDSPFCIPFCIRLKKSPILPSCGNLHPAQRAKPVFSKLKPSFVNYLEISFFQAFSIQTSQPNAKQTYQRVIAMARLTSYPDIS